MNAIQTEGKWEGYEGRREEEGGENVAVARGRELK
jgi:hypothetical protein